MVDEKQERIREATKKRKKISQQVWTISENGEPLPLFHNNFSHFRNLKINVFFAIIKSLRMRGIDKNKKGDLFIVKL